MRDAICDTSPLQYLHQAALLDLLPRLYSRIVVPGAVASEIDQGISRGVALPDLRSLDWIEIGEAVERPVSRPLADLGAGEREVLVMASESVNPLVIIDDALARRYARLLDVPCTGTLGVLLRAKREGHLEAVGPVLDLLDDLRFRLDPATRRAVLDLAGEHRSNQG